jgi:hypothetical protein
MADDKIIKIGDTKYALHPDVYGLLQKLNTENSSLKEAIMEWYGQEERDISSRSALYPIAEIAKTLLPKGSTVADDAPEEDEDPDEVDEAEERDEADAYDEHNEDEDEESPL